MISVIAQQALYNTIEKQSDNVGLHTVLYGFIPMVYEKPKFKWSNAFANLLKYIALFNVPLQNGEKSKYTVDHSKTRKYVQSNIDSE